MPARPPLTESVVAALFARTRAAGRLLRRPLHRSQLDNGRIGTTAVAEARSFFFSVGDPSPKMRSHGTGPQRVRWFNAGYLSGSYETCESVIRKEHAMPRIPDH